MIGLPSLRTLDGAQAYRVWLAAESADMRSTTPRTKTCPWGPRAASIDWQSVFELSSARTL